MATTKNKIEKEEITIEEQQEVEYYIEKPTFSTKLKRLTSYLIDFFTIFIFIIILDLIDTMTFHIFYSPTITNIVGVLILIIIFNPQSFLLFVFDGKSPGVIFDNIEFINQEGNSLKRKDYLLKTLFGIIIWIVPLLPLLNTIKIIGSEEGQSITDKILKQFVIKKETPEKEISEKSLIIGLISLMIIKILEVIRELYIFIINKYETLDTDPIIILLISVSIIVFILEIFINQFSKNKTSPTKLSILLGLFTIFISGFVSEKISLNIICVLISLVGLILGIKGIKEEEKGKYGIILNTFTMLASTIVIAIIIIFSLATPNIKGYWYCEINDEFNEENDSVYMHLYKDKTFYINNKKLGGKSLYEGTYTYDQIDNNIYNLRLDISNKDLQEQKTNIEVLNYEITLEQRKFLNIEAFTMKDIRTEEIYHCETIDN